MNTTTAASQAHVTVDTIRTWCRRGVVTATKRAGRWVLDAASLAHRLTIGAVRARKQAAVYRLDRSRSWRTPGQFTAIGPATALQAAFESQTPVPLSGDFDGDRVYLGISGPTYGDMGIVEQRLGRERLLGDDPDNPGVQLASYLINPRLLQDAPRLAALIDREQAEADALDARIAAEDDRYLNPDYE
ncbi:hypothetical protein [Streptomyces sp. H27-D2]|uniref:hypothetical protein n=1 Tax=Streptomyces sp. H27-D2 TaxID=3046304 RepID=UPI002DBFB8C8|nr:hypothetical protein [Streptomyces sp. H27-D2]MEC4016059.1 hypothetical protein [Streptomyces sp. H27-D2]